MFVFDFVTDKILGEILDWMFSYQIALLNYTFMKLNGMGAELFTLTYTNALVLFFSRFGFALYVVGILVAVFECALEYQGGRGSIKDTALNIIKGFLAAKLFSSLPVVLYLTAIRWQTTLGIGLTGIGEMQGVGDFACGVLERMNEESHEHLLFYMVASWMIGYAVIKVFFANIKRGGILIIQIAVGSLYMFSIPRGYLDGFKQWVKQVIGLCLTAFLQTILLTVGLMIIPEHLLLGVGVMLSATEVPKICGAFGLDTSTKTNVMSGVYAAQAAFNLGKTLTKIVA